MLAERSRILLQTKSDRSSAGFLTSGAAVSADGSGSMEGAPALNSASKGYRPRLRLNAYSSRATNREQQLKQAPKTIICPTQLARNINFWKGCHSHRSS